MAGLKWNTGKLYYSTVELGYQQPDQLAVTVTVLTVTANLGLIVNLLTLNAKDIIESKGSAQCWS